MTLAALKARLEIRTGIIWGTYALDAPKTYIQRNAKGALHPNGFDLVRIEAGIRRRGFYLHWGEK